MAYTIVVNGIAVEGASLKEATKLAKKEEKRQALAIEEQSRDREKANIQAYVALGKSIALLKSGNFIIGREKIEASLSLYRKEDHSLFIESADGEVCYVRLAPQESADALLLDWSCRVLAVKVRYTFSDETHESQWSSYGAHGETYDYVRIPKFLADRLEEIISESEALAA